MKPLHLTLRGFTAFRQTTDLDFADLELFALVGPTGSGKSSLLDAMTFALYGETARLGATGLDALISQGERTLSVALTFEAGGQTYRVTRTRGRKQADNEVRLDRLDPDGEWTGLSSGSQKDIAQRIEDVVGLDFDTFTRCVMLPQGQFAALLHGKARQRQELLGELTGMGRVQQMQTFAADQVKDFKHQSQSLGSVLASEYAGVSEEAAAAVRAQREQTDADAERLLQQREELRTQLQRLREQEKVWRNREDTARRLTVQESRAEGVRQGAERARRARQVAGVLPLLDAAERARIAFERQNRELAGAERALETAQTQEARAAGMPEHEIAALEKAAQEHQGRLAQLQATLADVQQQLGGKGFDPAELSQLLRDLTASEAALSSAQQEGGKLAEQERSLRERLSLKATKEAEAKAAAGQFDTWQTLTNALRANEFQQFMLAETEADLLTNAGQLLYDISDGRYRLKLEKNDYAVQDLWNAGEIRAVKTLSGGETFLASLALAIALSDYLAGNRVLGALFLDEGFGTLDPQALDAVATALENLRTQGRMVGIVTHVESLSERLPARLLVSKSMAGSQVMRVEGL